MWIALVVGHLCEHPPRGEVDDEDRLAVVAPRRIARIRGVRGQIRIAFRAVASAEDRDPLLAAVSVVARRATVVPEARPSLDLDPADDRVGPSLAQRDRRIVELPEQPRVRSVRSPGGRRVGHVEREVPIAALAHAGHEDRRPLVGIL